MSRTKQLTLVGWREPVEPEYQVGQLLFYMLGAHLKTLQLYLAGRDFTPTSTSGGLHGGGDGTDTIIG